jgi:hypothetical protein
MSMASWSDLGAGFFRSRVTVFRISCVSRPTMRPPTTSGWLFSRLEWDGTTTTTLRHNWRVTVSPGTNLIELVRYLRFAMAQLGVGYQAAA